MHEQHCVAFLTCPRRPRSEILFVSHLSSGGLAPPSGMALPPLLTPPPLPRTPIGGGYCGGGCCCGLGEYSPRIPDGGTKPKLVSLKTESEFGTSSAYLSNALYTVHLTFRIFFPNSFNITWMGRHTKGPRRGL